MPEAERLALNDDGTVEIAWEGREPFMLRRPNIGQYRQLVEAFDRQRAAAQALVVDGSLSDADLLGTAEEPGPFLVFYPQVFSMLADVTVAPEELPLWCQTAAVFMELRDHWRENPLDRGRRTTTPLLDSLTTTPTTPTTTSP